MVPRCNLKPGDNLPEVLFTLGPAMEAPGRPHVSSPQCYLLQWSCCGALWANEVYPHHSILNHNVPERAGAQELGGNCYLFCDQWPDSV